MEFQEKDSRVMTIQDNQLHCTDSRYNYIVNLDQLEFIYIDATKKMPYLLFFETYQKKIPIEFKGFKAAYDYLSKQFELDDDLFYTSVEKKQKNRLWRKKYPQNYEISERIEPITKGFTANSEWIDWDKPTSDFHESETIRFETDGNKKYIHFNNGVKIGNIVVEELCAHVGNRIDAPILYYTAKLRHKKQDDSSYFDAKKALDQWRKSMATKEEK